MKHVIEVDREKDVKGFYLYKAFYAGEMFTAASYLACLAKALNSLPPKASFKIVKFFDNPSISEGVRMKNVYEVGEDWKSQAEKAKSEYQELKKREASICELEDLLTQVAEGDLAIIQALLDQ